MGPSLRRAVIAAIGLAAAGGIALWVALWIGGDDGSDVIVDTIDHAHEQGTVRSVFSFSLDAPPGFEDQASSFGGEGSFDLRNNRSLLSFTFLGELGGDGDDASAPESLQLELLADGSQLYLHMPFLVSAAPDGEEWFSVDADSLGELARIEGGLGLGASDPIQTLEYLRGASDDVEKVGEEAVGGTDTIHYRTAVDLEAAVAMTPPSRRQLVADAVEQFREQFGTVEIPLDVWVDGEGLARRIRYELDLATANDRGGVPEGAIMSFTMELFDYGAAVEIAPPPPDEVSDLARLLERLDGGN